jgi:hypothetical protein
MLRAHMKAHSNSPSPPAPVASTGTQEAVAPSGSVAASSTTGLASRSGVAGATSTTAPQQALPASLAMLMNPAQAVPISALLNPVGESPPSSPPAHASGSSSNWLTSLLNPSTPPAGSAVDKGKKRERTPSPDSQDSGPPRKRTEAASPVAATSATQGPAWDEDESDFEERDLVSRSYAQFFNEHYSADPDIVTMLDMPEMERRMNDLHARGLLARSLMDEPPCFIDATDRPEAAAGTVAAAPCVVVLVKAQTGEGAQQRTYLGSIHASDDRVNFNRRSEVADAGHIFDKLDAALAKLDPAPARKQYYFAGGTTQSMDACTRLIGAADDRGLDVAACLFPLNRLHQSSDMYLTRDTLFVARENKSLPKGPAPSGMIWLGGSPLISSDESDGDRDSQGRASGTP